MIELVIFDLDDTLYPESSFAHSGFKAVSSWMAAEVGLEQPLVYDLLLELHSESSSLVFNRLLDRLDLTEAVYLDALIDCYRKHQPIIELYEDACRILNYLKAEKYKLGLITDGYLQTQRNKVKALGLETFINKIIYTDAWGRGYWKPHPRSYQTMLEQFKIAADRAVYVADNPAKDFVAPRAMGMHTVQIVRAGGVYAKVKAVPDGEAEQVINSLDELQETIVKG